AVLEPLSLRPNALSLIDAHTRRVVARVGLGKQASAADVGPELAFSGHSAWISLFGAQRLVRVDVRTHKIMSRVKLPWSPAGLVLKLDPVENKMVRRIPLHGWIGDLAVGAGLVWAPVVQDGQIYKLSEDDLSVQGLVPAGADPERISIGGDRVWVANAAGKTVSLIDLHTGARPRLPTSAEPTAVAYHDGLVWTGAAPKPLPLPSISGQELRISTPSPS